MNRKSLVKKPKSAYLSYITNRKLELFELTGLLPKELNDLVLDEWRLLKAEDKNPLQEAFMQEKLDFESNKDSIYEIDVDGFMSDIKVARKQKDMNDEFKEDYVLSILNHKKMWKKTWSRKKKEKVRTQKAFTPLQVKKIAKLKLN